MDVSKASNNTPIMRETSRLRFTWHLLGQIQQGQNSGLLLVQNPLLANARQALVHRLEIHAIARNARRLPILRIDGLESGGLSLRAIHALGGVTFRRLDRLLADSPRPRDLLVVFGPGSVDKLLLLLDRLVDFVAGSARLCCRLPLRSRKLQSRLSWTKHIAKLLQ